MYKFACNWCLFFWRRRRKHTNKTNSNNYSFNSKDQCGKYVFNLMIVTLAFSVLFISFCIAFFSKLGSFWLLSASIVSLTIAVSCFIPAYLKVKEGPIVGISVQ